MQTLVYQDTLIQEEKVSILGKGSTEGSDDTTVSTEVKNSVNITK